MLTASTVRASTTVHTVAVFLSQTDSRTDSLYNELSIWLSAG